MSPIFLTDEQSSAVLRAAMPLVPADRPAFLEEVAQALAGLPELGDGIVARVAREVPRREGGKRFWPIQPSLVKLIAANGGVVCWFPLLENLTSQQAKSGERVLFDRYGLSKWGGLWANAIAS
jgi:hypothetical protein